MLIRKFQEKDKKQLLRLFDKILYEIFKVKPKKFELDAGFLKTGGVLYVAEDKGKIIASGGIIKHNDNTARLKNMYMEKSYRGTGLAQKLYNKLQSFSKKAGYKRIILSTAPQMKVAIRFYQKNGSVQYRTNKKRNQIFFVKEI